MRSSVQATIENTDGTSPSQLIQIGEVRSDVRVDPERQMACVAGQGSQGCGALKALDDALLIRAKYEFSTL
jgi:hypothetical protein